MYRRNQGTLNYEDMQRFFCFSVLQVSYRKRYKVILPGSVVTSPKMEKSVPERTFRKKLEGEV